MEFDFNINLLFPDNVTLVGRHVPGHTQDSRFQQHKNLQLVIEVLGRKSAKAQQLTGSITSLHKSQIHGHHIFVLKNPSSNNGLGSVIGFVKVGKKRLFVLDHDGNHNEVFPLCVLDFYVHESQQRRGHGLQLFKHMLQHENVQPSHLAIDRPSQKFISFLKKHFNLWATIAQVNNFVIFEGFFKHRTDIVGSGSRHSRFSRDSQFRPLSRAVSDDVIKRNRQNDAANFIFKDIRPISGCENQLSQGHGLYSTRNNRRRKWNPDGTWQSVQNQSAPVRPNLYSRFTHENSKNLPPIPMSTRIHQNAVCDINKNPLPRKESENNKEFEIKSTHDFPRRQNDVLEGRCSNFVTMNDNEDNATADTKPLQDGAASKEENTNNRKNLEDMFSARKTPGNLQHTSQFVYSKPSDMIAELKAKDEQSLMPKPPPHQYNRRWQHHHLRGTQSSWNVLGIPKFSHWKAS
ncbi:alpha-tubulin N-acetyltransferase 1-like isoform X2 [Clavelina lepadiformis]|uniref:alpha-tubulin N-acetyltransferase 1-like isoform X2 n=1 Tax=Clavelina lepadiformis TaxID=159417 RepID=UPI004041170F